MTTPREKFREWLTDEHHGVPLRLQAILEIADKAAEFFAEPGQPSGLESLVRHLIDNNAVHRRKGTVLGKEDWGTVIKHLTDEVRELDVGILEFHGGHCTRDHLLQELGDILGIVVHATIKAGFTMAEVERREIAKLGERFECAAPPPQPAAVGERLAYDPPPPDMDLGEQVRHARGFAAGVCRNDHHTARLLEQMARSIEGLTTALREAGERAERLQRGIDAVQKLMAESTGVAGLHKNGNVAPWDELRAGGRFEEWLFDFDTALPPAASEAEAESAARAAAIEFAKGEG